MVQLLLTVYNRSRDRIRLPIYYYVGKSLFLFFVVIIHVRLDFPYKIIIITYFYIVYRTHCYILLY